MARTVLALLLSACAICLVGTAVAAGVTVFAAVSLKEALDKQPGGTNITLNKALLQAPGVVQDSYGVIHVRNEHANLQYRLNGVIESRATSRRRPVITMFEDC